MPSVHVRKKTEKGRTCFNFVICLMINNVFCPMIGIVIGLLFVDSMSKS